MSESRNDMLSRVRLMATGTNDTWDLSDNDVAALSYVLERLETLEPLYAASESLRQQVNDDRTKELIIYQKMRERLEKCEAALRTARMLLVSEGDPDEDGEMIVEIDELLGDAARAALEEK